MASECPLQALQLVPGRRRQSAVGCSSISRSMVSSNRMAPIIRSPVKLRPVMMRVRIWSARFHTMDILEPEIAQARMIIGATAKRPVIFALALPDREVVYAGDAQAH